MHRVAKPLSDDLRAVPEAGPRQVLIVDDSRAQRRMLGLALARSGYVVTEAASAEQALDLCRGTAFDIVISDWIMPGLSGLDFCRAFRGMARDGYGYFLLLTSKAGKDHIAEGLDAGADDFLTKPVDPAELRARLRAGGRILSMQDALRQNNRLLGQTLDTLQRLYDTLDQDVAEARKVQQTLVRDRHRDYGRGQVSVLLRPSGHVGGDLAGSFAINPRQIALYSVDVSGHGVASAMMTARLAGCLADASPGRNIALAGNTWPGHSAWPPEMVAFRLNRLMFAEFQVDQYFTMAYAEVDLHTGRAAMVQAGHPHPVILRADGHVQVLGQGGLPVGLVPEARYDRIEAQLAPGDRLLLLSDGVTECPSPRGELGEEGLAAILTRLAGMEDAALFEALVWELQAHSGQGEFADDVSGVMFRYTG